MSYPQHYRLDAPFNDADATHSSHQPLTSGSSGESGMVSIYPQQEEQAQGGESGTVSGEQESSSGGEGSNVNFMAQRPSFQVQLPFSSQFADRAPYGSGDVDDGYKYEFETIEKFQEWRRQIEEGDTVEFVKGDSHGSRAVPPRFREHVKLVCARHNRSGRKTYIKKYPERQRKVPSRKLGGEGCPAFISYKTYHNTTTVRAMYHSIHSHEIGLANLPFTRRGRKAAEEERKRQHARGLYRTNMLNSATGSAQTSQSSSSQSDVNITIDSGGSSPAPGSSHLLLNTDMGSGHVASIQSPPYLELVQQSSQYSPVHPSPLHLSEHPYQTVHSPRTPSQMMPAASLQSSSPISHNPYENLNLMTRNLHNLREGHPLTATPLTPVDSSLISPFPQSTPLNSPSVEAFSSTDQLLNHFHQPLPHAFEQSAHGLTLSSLHASPNSSSNSGGSSTRAHSSPMGSTFSPLHPHYHQIDPGFDVEPHSAGVVPQSGSVHHTHPGHVSEQSPSRWDRLVMYAQDLRSRAQNVEFSQAGIQALEQALQGLYSEANMYQNNNAQPNAMNPGFMPATMGSASATAVNQGLYAGHSSDNLARGPRYNQLLDQSGYAGLGVHADNSSSTDLHLQNPQALPQLPQLPQ